MNVWQPGAKASVLTGLRYHAGQTPLLTQEWTSTAIDAGVLASPVLSEDGQTVYVNGRDRQLWALNAADGKPKWSLPLDFQPQTPPSVAPEGLIVAGGGPGARLVALRDAGDHAEVQWRRDDVTPLTTSSQAGSRAAYVVAADGPDRMTLTVFDPADGGRTVNSYPLPEADGFPVGISVGFDRRVVVGTSSGQVWLPPRERLRFLEACQLRQCQVGDHEIDDKSGAVDDRGDHGRRDDCGIQSQLFQQRRQNRRHQ